MNGKQRLLRFAVILIVAGIGYWQRDHLPSASTGPKAEAPREKGTAVLKENPLPSPGGTVALPAKVHGYDKFTDARLVDAEGNDGDSFLVEAGGRKFVLRLYFVDAPEKYLSDRYEEQRRRVAEQAREMGGITPEEAVTIGQEAKEFTGKQLKGKAFTVFTYWEEVYDGDRYYGFVQLADGSYLGTRLVEQGLARIHTKGPGSKAKPVPTPDGASFFQHRDKLSALEQTARKTRLGAWRF
ncbi:MAG: thermonuclease family protein [Verrucomicrobiales bacterium]|nr:thermonuclease family protein [Verrucomicrobiales bacterium]MBP9224965.1 thermonuclease family protein [Verrucomicrobiales bacterium]